MNIALIWNKSLAPGNIEFLNISGSNFNERRIIWIWQFDVLDEVENGLCADILELTTGKLIFENSAKSHRIQIFEIAKREKKQIKT